MRRYNKQTTHIVMDIWGTGYEESEQFRRYVAQLALDYTGHDPRPKHKKTAWIPSGRLDQDDV